MAITGNDLAAGIIASGGFGLGIGLIAGLTISNKLNSRNNDVVKIFREENKPAVMRLYRLDRKDLVFIESSEVGEYVPFHVHLENFGYQADRELEEARIKKQVRWYEE